MQLLITLVLVVAFVVAAVYVLRPFAPSPRGDDQPRGGGGGGTNKSGASDQQ